jgi:hypothetical protein
MDDRIDDVLRDEARDYNEPPATPRAEMWERIAAARTEARKGATTEAPALAAETTHRRRILPPFRPSSLPTWLGIAALLALGIAIGRRMERTPLPQSPVAQGPVTHTPDTAATAVAPEPRGVESRVAATPKRQLRDGTPVIAAVSNAGTSARGDIIYSVALGQHLGQSETFLTLFRNSVKRGHVEPVAFATARSLLSTNRLLLDSRIGADPHTRQLLQDLELVLAQIAQLKPAGDSSDVHMITEDMDQGDVLPRLRIAVPAGT